MSSHSRSKTRHAQKKTMKRKHSQQKQEALTFSAQQTPFAPPELDAILGYGTSRSYPLFMAGIASMIKKAFGHRKTY